MTRGRTPRDLRERMERVAAKSRRPPESGRRRRSEQPAEPKRADIDVRSVQRADVTSVHQAGDAREGQRAAARARDATAAPARQGESRALDVRGTETRSRLETLLAWGRWELTVVPAQRWKWFRAAIRTDETQGHDRKRSR